MKSANKIALVFESIGAFACVIAFIFNFDFSNRLGWMVAFVVALNAIALRIRSMEPNR